MYDADIRISRVIRKLYPIAKWRRRSRELQRPLRGNVDSELLTGLFVLLAVLLAVYAGAAASFELWLLRGASRVAPAWRFLIALGVPTIAIWVAATQWTRRTLRFWGGIFLILILILLVRIGREQPAVEANRLLGEVFSTKTTLEEIATDKRRRQVASLPQRVDTLGSVIDEARAGVDPETQQGIATIELARRADAVYRVAVDMRPSPDGGVSRADLTRLRRSYREFRRLFISTVPRSDAEDAMGEAADAVVAAATAEKPDDTRLNSAMAAVCGLVKAAELTPSDHIEPCKAEPVDTLPVAVGSMRLRLAEYQEAVLARDADKVAAEQLQAEFGNLVAEAGPERSVRPSLADNFIRGAEAVVADAVGSEASSPGLTPVGWSLLVFLGLAGWRLVERRASRRMPGPVELEFVGVDPPERAGAEGEGEEEGAAEATKVAQEAEFRSAVLQNLDEPAPVPGATILSTLTDLPELPNAPTTVVSSIASAIRSVFTSTGGYLVQGALLPPGAGVPQKWRAFVRITDRWTGSRMATSATECDSAAEASRAAGYAAAAIVLSLSPRIPTWLKWDEDTSRALATHSAHRAELTDLEQAVREAPSSGVLLRKLANKYDLAGRHLEALSMNARAVAAYPRYVDARYRLAVSALILAKLRLWKGLPYGVRQRIVDQLERASTQTNIRHDDLGELTGADDKKANQILDCFARKHLKSIARDARLLPTVWRALRRSERAVWWREAVTSYQRFSARKQVKWIAKSAILQFASDREARRVERRARDRRSWWQLSYNLACLHSTKTPPEHETALRWLETALERPHSEQIPAQWLEADPDLEAIRAEARFRWMVTQLPDKKE